MRGGAGARDLRQEVEGRLRRLEASLSAAAGLPPASRPAFAAGDSGPEGRQAVLFALASVQPAFRLATACAQMAREIQPALQARPGGARADRTAAAL